MSVNNKKSIEKRNLPSILVTEQGKKISTIEEWEQKRRPEILNLFKENIFGRPSVSKPYDLEFKVDKKGKLPGGRGVRKQVTITYYNSERKDKGIINLIIILPQNDRPVPGFLLINNRSSDIIDPEKQKNPGFWPYAQIVERGYAAIAFNNSDLAEDSDDAFDTGVFKVFEKEQTKRPQNAWGAISAWAWGASRVMDYLVTDKDIDNQNIGVVGHSRGGKTALWCGAQDERFALTVSNNSGCTGAALARGSKGETIKNINRFSHWFCDNYNKYNENEEQLPVDQHMLLALIAPRNVYVASAAEDSWSDPESEFLACIAAQPVFDLYGYQGLGTLKKPAINENIHKGKIGYHIREGRHGLGKFDWNQFIDYANFIF